MDEILDAVKKRRSVRDFKDQEIPEGLIRKLTDALIWAPSAGNLQSRVFFFVSNVDVKCEIAVAAFGQIFIAGAPLVVIGCANSDIGRHYGDRGVNLYMLQDVACSIMSMMLVAVENGLGSAWVGAFKEKEVSRILQLPNNLRPVAIVPVGYPEKVPSAPDRVTVSEAVRFV